MDVAYEVIGRFHPALVHLPIGFLILAVLFVWLDQLGKIKVSPDVIRLSFGLGAIAAILSCITGLLLSRDGGYDGQAVSWHQWMGITTTVASILLWRIRASLLKWTSTMMLVMLIVTGHLGASLTHGSGYLTAPLASPRKSFDLATVRYDSAAMYDDVIAPILEEHCYSCHSSGKQKGKLRLDGSANILAGGKSGKVIVAGNLQESEMMERLRLPLDDEHHMPPKEKRQPDDSEIELIAQWIETGADFNATLESIIIKKDWSALVSGDSGKADDDIPDEKISAPDERIIDDLISLGVSVSRVDRESNYLQVNLVSVPEHPDVYLRAMKDIAPNVIWLRLGNTGFNDDMSGSLAQFRNLTRLGLERTFITDAGIENLKALSSLSVLNLSGTQVSLDGLTRISNLRNIRSLNLYQTQVRPGLLEQVRKLFPGAEIEFGEYDVPMLATDTAEIR